MNSVNPSEQHCSYYCCGEKGAAELTHPDNAWLERGSSAAIIPNTSEEDDSLVLPDCTRAAVYLSEPFLDIFALHKKVNSKESHFVYIVFPLWFGHPEMQPQLSRHWSLPEPGGWDIDKGQGPALVRRAGEETGKDLGPATVQLLQYTANNQFLLNLQFKSEEFLLMLTSLAEGSVAA